MLAQKLNPALYLSRKPDPSRTLLHPISGILRGGETTMVIGKPGSGCTTFLKTVANLREEYEAVTGEVCYNGLDAAEMKARRPGDVAFAGTCCCQKVKHHFNALSVTLMTVKLNR
jgi:ABC-type multidrug transport system ATPase subunit